MMIKLNFISSHRKRLLYFLNKTPINSFGTSSSPPILHGIRVLDLSRILVGPYATMYLGDLGAEIIKLESPDGDETRRWGPPFCGPDSTYYLSVNRLKKSIVIDLKKPEGLNIVYDLIKKSDILVENFATGVTERLKIDYNTIKPLNEKIIYASITGYGSNGPHSEKPGFDLITQAISGYMHITGEQEPHSQPMKVGVAITDVLTGLNIVNGILAALYSRKLTGKGQKVETSLLESSISSLVNIASAYLNADLEAKRYGNHHPSIVPYGVYKVGKNDHLAIACATNKHFMIMCEAIGRKDISENEKFKSNGLRVHNRNELNSLLEIEFEKFDFETLIKLLEKNKIPCGPINNISKLFNDEQVKALKVVEKIEDENHGDLQLIRNPLKFSESSMAKLTSPPTLGQNTVEILTQILGYEIDLIEELRMKKVIN